jgi:hypothetical protein
MSLQAFVAARSPPGFALLATIVTVSCGRVEYGLLLHLWTAATPPGPA